MKVPERLFVSADRFDAMFKSAHLYGGSAAYLEQLYECYLDDAASIPDHWREIFDQFNASGKFEQDISHQAIQQTLVNAAKQSAPAVIQSEANLNAQANVDKMIHAYRLDGHLAAQLDPLNSPRQASPALSRQDFDLVGVAESEQFHAQSALGGGTFSLSSIESQLKQIYCGNIGFEYMHIGCSKERAWLQKRIEQTQGHFKLSSEQQKRAMELLVKAEGLEQYLGSKYVGQKRFSLEGCDAFVPLMDAIIHYASELGTESAIVGMAHRGRLNMLVNLCGQAPQSLFDEFEGKRDIGLTSGDVKYHLGFSSDIPTKTGSIHLSLAFNPSHLEFISSVVMGSARARQDVFHEGDRSKSLPILVHGDASFAGQGIVMETLNMSQTSAYKVGGSVHVVINNQIGFTTNKASDARSSEYCTDIAKVIDAPIFHVNADDVESVVFLAKLAMDYRHQFRKDIVIDLIGYRRHGHNEADEPASTQPMMYKKIRQHASACALYAEHLVKEQRFSENQIKKMKQDYRDLLDIGNPVVKTLPGRVADSRTTFWAQYINQSWDQSVDTGIDHPTLKSLGEKITQLPPGFTLQRQVGNMMKSRASMVQGEKSFDWGYAETLAYASLLDQGYFVRISGQDAQRGTFSHRYAVLHDHETGEEYMPLKQIGNQSRKDTIEIYNSLLSEQGVMGFEYGYAGVRPKGLTIWEAQFGDFANGAQVIIDQFLSSGWQKWGRLCGLVLLLPHGYEGMGPEHSSARLERFLQLCAQENMQVCVPTTPAQIFHLLRRQVLRPFRKPLVVMTPKSMLRNKLAVSEYTDLEQGEFQLVIPETDPEIKPASVKRVVLCSGKIYYELLSERRTKKQDDVAIIRIEQLFPFPEDIFKKVLKPYQHVTDIVWCQEEPRNQGAWYCSRHHFEGALGPKQMLHYVGRPYSAAPAVGYPKLYKKLQETVVQNALTLAAYPADSEIT